MLCHIPQVFFVLFIKWLSTLLNRCLLILYRVFPFVIIGSWPGICHSNKGVTITVLIFMFWFHSLKRCHSYLENCFFFWLIWAVMLFEAERICLATKANILQYTATNQVISTASLWNSVRYKHWKENHLNSKGKWVSVMFYFQLTIIATPIKMCLPLCL